MPDFISKSTQNKENIFDSNKDERELVKKFLSWDRKVQEDFFGQYIDYIFKICFRVLQDEENARDVCQTVCIKIMNNLKNFAFKSQLKTWISKIAYNESILFLKKQKDFISLEEVENFIPCKENNQDFLKEDMKQILTEKINELDPASKSIVLFFYYDDLKLKEIADIMSLNENTVKTKLSRAKAFLQLKLAKYEGIY